MSRTIRVPPGVPSVACSSTPVSESPARKKTREPAVNSPGNPRGGTVSYERSNWVPAADPSLR
jgi:hypothetical protein